MNKILESKVSKLFKTLSDPTRIKILYLLNDKALTVTEIHTTLNMSQTAVSHQLKVLRDINLVKAKRDGKNIYYSLADSHVYEIFNQAIEQDRKSTRLNSSHVRISYAVFCLKKKK